MLAGFGEHYGVDFTLAIKLGRAFGTGMGRGRTCGAIIGALMVIGLSLGEPSGNDSEARPTAYVLSRELVKRFQESEGTVICAELLGVNPGTPEGLQAARERNLFKDVCPRFVSQVSGILRDLLEKSGQ